MNETLNFWDEEFLNGILGWSSQIYFDVDESKGCDSKPDIPWKFNSSPLKISRDPKGKDHLPSITGFRGG